MEKKQEKENREEKISPIVPDKFKDIVEKIEKMTVLDLAELVKILEKKFNVSAVIPTVAQAGQGAISANEKKETEEKSIFNIFLKEIGDKKIEVIKAVRDITNKGLKESKDLVDAVSTESQLIKQGAKKEDAEEIKKRFETVGAKVELK